MHTVNYKKYFYIAVFLLVTIIAYIVEVKYKFIRRMDADWISALATFVAVPVSIFSLAFQMKKENDDRRYDARTIFSVTWKKGIFYEGTLWVHDNKNGTKLKKMRNSKNKVGTEESLYPTIENVGSKLAQEVLVEFECVAGSEYFSKTIVKPEEKFSVFLDSKIIKKSDILNVNIYYLSELGERIKFKYDTKSKLICSKVIHDDQWREKVSFSVVLIL